MAHHTLASRLSRGLVSGAQNGLKRRAFHRTANARVAHEFSMPAMSPTMTEGNITRWKVNEGDSFAAGDVLLEIETDKAQMDVEAQDDGIMAKIIQGEGAKAVKIGTRIAITADADDDIKTLDLENFAIMQESEETGKAPSESAKEFQQQATTPSSSAASTTPSAGESRQVQYPLFPSVTLLLHENNIEESEIAKITATGPNGRLLKGDILAYLGKINADYPSAQSNQLRKLGKLDLSNIEIVESAKPKDTPAPAATIADKIPMATVSDIVLPISLSTVFEVRERVRETLGIEIDVETFIARATRLCNTDLPRSRSKPPTSDDLFNAVLGLDSVSGSRTGTLLIPHIEPMSLGLRGTFRRTPRGADVIDFLSQPRRTTSRPRSKPISTSISHPENTLFRLTVPSEEVDRAKVFLQRMKTVLQTEPGKLLM